MHTFDLLRMIFDNLRRQKGRVVLTALGVVIGTASIVLLVSLASGMQENMMSQFAKSGTLTSINVYPGDPNMGPGGVPQEGKGGGGANANQALLTTSAIQQISGLSGVKIVMPRVQLETYGVITVGKLETGANVFGVATHDTGTLDVAIAQGSGIIGKNEAIIGGWMAKNFYNPSSGPNGYNDPQAPELLGKRVRFVITKYSETGEVRKTIDLKIVGITQEVLSEYDSSVLLYVDDVEALNEWVRGKRINRKREGYPELLVKVDSIDSVLVVADKIQKMGYRAQTPMSFIKQIQNTFTIMQIVFGSIGAISLLVAAIGIANTMTMAILERTREIGLMKAIGATNRDILSIFLGEAASIGFIGGASGTLIGWGLGKLFNGTLSGALSSIFPVPTTPGAAVEIVSTPLWLVIFAITFATLIGLLSGLYPSIRAAMMEPVTALKHD